MNFEYDKSVNILANSWRLQVLQNESTKRKKYDPGKKNFFQGEGGSDFFQISGEHWPKSQGLLNFHF